MTKKLESDRLFLREMEEKDWLEVHQYASKAIVSQFQPWGPNTEEESKAFVDRIIIEASKKLRTRFAFGIIKTENEKLIGVGELNIRDIENKTAELAYIVNPDFWGNGYATESAKLLLKFGFEEFNLHRIYATCDTRNIGSAKVLAKIGMTLEGRMREDLLIKDGWRDSLLYSILEQEFEGII